LIKNFTDSVLDALFLPPGTLDKYLLTVHAGVTLKCLPHKNPGPTSKGREGTGGGEGEGKGREG